MTLNLEQSLTDGLSVLLINFVSQCSVKEATDNYLVSTVPKFFQFWNNFWIQNPEMSNRSLKQLYVSGY